MSVLRSQRGGSPVMTLFGVVMMLCLTAYSVKQMQGPEGEGLEAIDKAKDAACATQRSQMSRDIVMFLVDHPGKKPSIDAMNKAGTEIPVCPGEGEYEVHGRKVLCTAHSYKDEFEEAMKTAQR